MIAEIITIGDEILIGQVIDSNSAWIAQKLNAIGIQINQISSVSDNREAIISTLNDAFNRVDIVFITGGLGPTKDDITKKTLAHYFNSEMQIDERTLAQVKSIFAKRNAPLLDINIQQAEVPIKCDVIHNPHGTAPGMWFHQEGKVCISMPGVPFEMMYMMEETIIPKLTSTFSLPAIVHQTILTAGIGESFLSKKIAAIEDSLPEHIKLAYLPKLGMVRLRLSAYGTHHETLKKELETYTQKIQHNIPENIIACEDITIEQALLYFMTKHKKTLSLAESCTGGYLSHLITKIPGSSAVLYGDIVAYSNQAKVALLDVNPNTLTNFGAVSEQTVKEMAEGALKKFGSDYAIAVTGIAGPDGGTENKPVGTIWIAIANKQQTIVQQHIGSNKRIQNIERTATHGFTMLFQLLKADLQQA